MKIAIGILVGLAFIWVCAWWQNRDSERRK